MLTPNMACPKNCPARWGPWHAVFSEHSVFELQLFYILMADKEIISYFSLLFLGSNFLYLFTLLCIRENNRTIS